MFESIEASIELDEKLRGQGEAVPIADPYILLEFYLLGLCERTGGILVAGVILPGLTVLGRAHDWPGASYQRREEDATGGRAILQS